MTGGASGIGAATVSRFRSAGARVAALDRDAARLETVDADFRVAADVSSEGEVARALEEATGRLGGLDALVACAGVRSSGSVADLVLAEWERVFAVNVRGVFLAARAAIPHLRAGGGGAIVNVASQAGIVGVAGMAAYCASKGAVIQLTRAMALDHSRDGIRVNCVCPGPTMTPMLVQGLASSPEPEERRGRLLEHVLHGRFVDPAEIAEAIWYLASPGAASTIGATLVVDGGYSIH